MFKKKHDLSSLKGSMFQANNLSSLQNKNLNLTQIDENKSGFKIENQEKLNNMYLKKVKSSKNVPNLQQNNNNVSQLNHTANIFGETPLKENLFENYASNLSTLREGRSVYLNFGRLCDERDDRSKSPKLTNQNNITHLSQNKGVIKNIETNVKFFLIKNI